MGIGVADVPCAVAARLMGQRLEYVHWKLRSGCEWGEAFKLRPTSKKYDYRINPRKFAVAEALPLETVEAEVRKYNEYGYKKYKQETAWRR